MSQNNPPLNIDVPVSKGATEQEMENAIAQALESKWTDLQNCGDQFTSTVKFTTS